MEALLVGIFMKAIVPAIGTALSTIAGLGMNEARKLIKKKTKNEAAKAALTHITHTVETVVTNLEQTLVKEMKAKKRGKKKLTQTDISQLKARAFEKVISQVAEPVKKDALLAINNIHAFVTDKIEKTVHDMKPTERPKRRRARKKATKKK